MSYSDDFYKHFPSLNSNSDELRRHLRISDEYNEYISTLKKNDNKNIAKESPQQERIRRSRAASVSSASDYCNTPDEIFSFSEERNKFEFQKKEQQRKLYQQQLETQIAEQKLKKNKEAEKKKSDEEKLERNLRNQLKKIQKEKEEDPQYHKVYEHVSMSENDKDAYASDTNLSQNSSVNNDVYRYFSRSAKTDTDLFNYKKYFNDVRLDESPNEYRREPEKSNEIAVMKQFEARDFPKTKIDKCLTHAECGRCKKVLLCKDCEEHDSVSPDATNHLQIEYNTPESRFSKDQQVVVYRPSDQIAPYSAAEKTEFYQNTHETLPEFDEKKLQRYIQLYGDLKKKKLRNENLDLGDKALKKTSETEPKVRATRMTSTDLDEILSAAQYAVITQTGLAKKLLDAEHFKL